MASEILAIPEEKLKETIAVIRAGLKQVKVSKSTKVGLLAWCKEEEEYLEEMASED